MDIWMPISTFLGGVLLTVLLFVLPFTNKLTALSANQIGMVEVIRILSKRVDDHIASTPLCSFHQQIVSEGATSKAERIALEARLKRLEES